MTFNILFPTTLTLAVSLNLPFLVMAQGIGGEWETYRDLDYPDGIGGTFGQSICNIGDVDGDSFPDLAIFDPFFQGVKVEAVFVYSGATFQEIYSIEEPWYENLSHGSPNNGRIYPGKDFNSDGVMDYLVSSPMVANRNGTQDGGRISLHSGADGAILYRIWSPVNLTGHNFGSNVSFISDINGDQIKDLAISSRTRYYLFSGSNGVNLTPSSQPGGMTYKALENAGDLDGDGNDDLLVDVIIDLKERYLLALNLNDVRIIYAIPIYFNDIAQQGDCAVINDMTGDGIKDFLLTQEYGVGLHSGADGTQLTFFPDDPHEWEFGTDCGDIDGDGIRDFGLISEYDKHFTAFSGKDFSPITSFEYSASWDTHALNATFLGDLDFNGSPEFSFPFHNHETQIFDIYFKTFNPFLSLSKTTLSASGNDPLSVDLSFSESQRRSAYVLLPSASGQGPTTIDGVEIPLTTDAYFNAILGGFTPASIYRPFGVLDGQAQAQVTIHEGPALSALVGSTFHFAAVSLDRTDFTAQKSSISREVEITP
jgi:hypothetical protein